MLWWIALVVVGIAVAIVFDPKWVLAPLLGFAVFRVGIAMLRGMAHGVDEGPGEPEPVLGEPERTLYWCEYCGAELLLVVRGTETPPRHCGERMHERVEIVRRS